MATSWREELAWAAGFFDGEGCCRARRHGTLAKTPRRFQLVLDVSQKDRRVLDRFRRAVGVGAVYGPYRAPHRVQYHFATTDFEACQAVIAMLWSWLGPLKREQARVALVNVVAAYRTSRRVCTRGHARTDANTRHFVTASGRARSACLICERIRHKRPILRVMRPGP